MSIEAMKQTLEALEYPGPSWPESRERAAQALRAAIAEAEKQEPVAHVYLFEPNGRPRVAWDNANGIKIGDKLYTSPPQRKPLTDEEIMDNWLKVMWAVGDRNKLPIPEFARAIEAAHGIKENT